MRYVVAWMLGVPFSVIVLWYVVGHAACGRQERSRICAARRASLVRRVTRWRTMRVDRCGKRLFSNSEVGRRQRRIAITTHFRYREYRESDHLPVVDVCGRGVEPTDQNSVKH